jgi:Mrp family chromosome partitioning ATPase
MSKILYAINQKETEDEISAQIKDFAVPIAAVQYKEAVLSALANYDADILLILESLPGTLDFLTLLKNVRIQNPNVRIICILNEREDKQDPMLSSLVALGIYDIINQNRISITDIVSYIQYPRTFRDASVYYNGVPAGLIEKPEEPEEPEEKPSTPGGFFGNLFGKSKPKKKASSGIVINNPPSSSSANVDIETLRTAIQEEADRKAQVKVEQIARELTKKETVSLRNQLDQASRQLQEVIAEKKTAEEQNYRAISELDAVKRELLATNQELATLKEQSTETISTYKAQIDSLGKATSTDVFSKKMGEWQKREKDYQSEIKTLKDQLQAAIAAQAQIKEAPPAVAGIPTDFTAVDMASFIMPDDPADYVTVKNANTHTYLFAGTKHGVGNTTAALNMAAALAEKGYKTLFMEFNSHYPMVNEYFEFISVPRGIDTAIAGLKSGNRISVDAAIIKPHGIQTGKKALSRAYARLPGALHFMLFSNHYLQQEKQGGAGSFDPKDLLALFHYLSDQLGYLYIIIDIQPDDDMGRNIFRQCGEVIDQLVLTCTQDPHSITTAGLMINDLARSRSSELVKTMKVLVSGFNTANDLSIGKIAKWLNMSQKRFFQVTDDRVGYYKAAYAMTPYLLSGGRFAKEFYDMAAEL